MICVRPSAIISEAPAQGWFFFGTISSISKKPQAMRPVTVGPKKKAVMYIGNILLKKQTKQ